jgi:hypothetical protein
VLRLGFRTPPGKAAPKTASVLVDPVGEWDKLECVCAGDRITVVLNGTTVNVATRVSQTRGRIFIESQGAEISFRTIDLKTLTRAELLAGR